MIEILNATRWMCWRCGGSFEGPIPYQAKVTPTEPTIGEGGVIWVQGMICRHCVEDRNTQWALPLLNALQRGQKVYWKLRVRLAWMILRGRLPLGDRGKA